MAIDPDVFKAALDNNKECEQVLNWVADPDHPFEYKFAVDQNEEIYQEYRKIRDGQTENPVAVRLLGDIISQIEIAKEEKRKAREEGEAKAKRKRNRVPKSKRKQKTRQKTKPESTSRIKFLRSTCSDRNIEFIIDKRKYEGIEKTLICMCTDAPNSGLTIVLTNPQNQYPRKLHKPRFREEIYGVMPKLKEEGVSKLKIVCASENKITYPSLDPRLDKRLVATKNDTDRLFEKMAEYVIREHYRCPHCYAKTPAEVYKQKQKGGGEVGEVDLYGYDRESSPWRIWVGECKLRKKSEDKLITTGDVDQLATKLHAIKTYEEKKHGGPVEIDPFIISNAKDMEPRAWEEARKIENFKFIRTRLTSNWQKSDDWRIVKVEPFEPVLVGSSWQGKSLKTINLE